MEESKGTCMYCPRCRQYTDCEAIPIQTRPDSLFQESNVRDRDQRYEHETEADLKWFRRNRRCSSCKAEFLTAELPEVLVEEIAALRHICSLNESKMKRYQQLLREISDWHIHCPQLPERELLQGE